MRTLDPLLQQTMGQRVETAFTDVKLINIEYCNGKYLNTFFKFMSGPHMITLYKYFVQNMIILYNILCVTNFT